MTDTDTTAAVAAADDPLGEYASNLAGEVIRLRGEVERLTARAEASEREVEVD